MEMITVYEASRRTGIPLAEIFRAIDTGRLAIYRVDVELKVRAADLAKLPPRH